MTENDYSTGEATAQSENKCFSKKHPAIRRPVDTQNWAILSFFIYPATDLKAYKLNISGQDRKAARAALITAVNTSKTRVI